MRRGIKSVCVVSPTGSGKTALTAQMIANSQAKGMRALFIVHRRELINQSISAFDNAGVQFGVIAANFQPAKAFPVQIASIQTLARRLSQYKEPNLVVWDETHHLAAQSWASVFRTYPDAYHVGLTATPERMDGRGLREYYQAIVQGPSVEWLIDNKFLADYRIFAPSTINTDNMHIRMGDYITSVAQAAVDKPTITGCAIQHYKKHCMGARAVAFCVSIQHSEHVAQQFCAAGIPACHIDGTTPTIQRDYDIGRFQDGQIKVLCNVDLFGEGFDLPSLEATIMLRPTASVAIYLQQVGRALRPYPGKRFAVILDHVGNCLRHGLPDEDRAWSLDGFSRKKKKNQDAESIKICPHCFAAQPSGSTTCRHCGGAFEKNPRVVEETEGSLEEIDRETIRKERLTQQGKAKSFDELVELGRQRKYKRPYLWAKHIWNARQAKINKGEL